MCYKIKMIQVFVYFSLVRICNLCFLQIISHWHTNYKSKWADIYNLKKSFNTLQMYKIFSKKCFFLLWIALWNYNTQLASFRLCKTKKIRFCKKQSLISEIYNYFYRKLSVNNFSVFIFKFVKTLIVLQHSADRKSVV